MADETDGDGRRDKGRRRRFGPKADHPAVAVTRRAGTAGATAVSSTGPASRPPPARRARPGLPARLIAADVVAEVLAGQMLDTVLEWTTIAPRLARLEARDRALVRAIATTTLRHHGEIDDALARFIAKPLPKEAHGARAVLMVAVAQLLYMDVPDHAAVSLAMDSLDAAADRRPWKPLSNAVLRRIATEGAAIRADQRVERLALPAWLRRRWDAAYGEATTREMIAAILTEPALDLTVKSDPSGWAARLGGIVLPTGGVRLVPSGPVQELPGFAEGEWWVQDAAATLPVRLFGDVAGLAIADLCAAPGGKTAQLAHCGAHVTAIDQSERRLARVRETLSRLRLDATLVAADAGTWAGGAFDAILLDAPCTATGTLRRHPDIGLHRDAKEIATMAAEQRRLLDRAIRLVRPGGLIVFSTCSLEPEEGPDQIRRLMQIGAPVERVPVTAGEVGGLAELITAEGDLRTLPSHLPRDEPRLGGLDGFFAARLRRTG